MSIEMAIKIVKILVYFLGIPVLAFLIGKQFVESRHMSERWTSECNFSVIRSMLLSYHNEHNSFPPTKYQAKPGGPMHSWRVLLLSCNADTVKLYSKYDFSEAWDSPKNLVIEMSLPQYNWFSTYNNEYANYLSIGEGEEWPSKKPLKSLPVTKGKDRFLIVEDPDSKIRWMEPKY